ncbi:6-phospho-beta-glucosidase [Arthrobacter sp. ov118]|uniref:family 4 glycosyl hydrolase n=1 Tax=Arthrobacter sp. ov118 TaxID=1761747 RepID=UPI0008EC4A91|nr:6-phospho-beta-glucosidase [Arthrobacter sp. ov118]SFT41614.1 6-phospho-beta-glucosidase [Arthrobacter sp. ov118]
MRLTIVGGGGFRVPLIYRALAAGPFAGLVRELVLYDVDAGRLAAIEAVLASLALQDPPGPGPRVRAVSALSEALEGADMVFAAIRPGGTAGRIADERIALDLGLLGQETTGAGGISYALRSIPPMLALAADMRSRCPGAWLLNFTNPAGIVTEALVPVLGQRVIGICDSAGGLVHRAARAAGAALPEGRLDGVGYYGLNHLGWLYRLQSEGRDALPELLADPAALAEFEEGRLFPPALLAGLGCLPNEYLFYYYETERALAGMRGAGLTRGESIARQQAELYPRLAAAGPQAFALWEAARRSREEGYLAEARGAGEHRDETDLAGGGYERVALAAMRALSGGGPADLILNTVNTLPGPDGNADGNTTGSPAPAIPGLPADAVVEIPCRVTTDGAVPLPQDPPGPAQLGLMRRVKDVERLVVEAVTTGSRDAALAAFARHPLVDSEVLAGKLLAGYEAAFPGLGHLWRGRP